MSQNLSPKRGPATATSFFFSLEGDHAEEEIMGKSQKYPGGNRSGSPNSAPIGPLGRSALFTSVNRALEDAQSNEDQLPGMDTTVSAMDQVAYGKHELNGEQQRNVMKRMFEAFDMQHEGYLNMVNLECFLGYLAGGSKDMEKVLETDLLNAGAIKNSSLYFDAFWTWWQQYEQGEKTQAVGKSNTLKMVSALFSAPFHQQQLLVSETGEKFTPSYRVHFHFQNLETGEVKPVSPWHDIPLTIRDVVRTTPASINSNKYNFICEIPKWTRAKFEISTNEPLNPIKQDMKNGVPRFYMHGDMMWNYGAFPQTWESTELTFVEGVKGDNDPVDAIEIGMTQFGTGSVAQVKILGVLGMIDAGEMDWKVICINRQDPIAKFLDDIQDVPKHLPGCLGAIREWLRTYKICQGGKENTFAFDGEYKDKAYTLRVIEESHRMWNNLVKIKQTSEV